ncbi:MAG: FHA domain-containing protein [Phycisphaerales bacterium]|nr:FHA domain-containing protein [Phycisphaerales bacterium]
MDVVLVMFKDSKRRDFPVKSKITTIGRRQDCDLRIPTHDVSRQHCRLDLGGEKPMVKDLGSSNGTYVNGQQVAEKVLNPGDVLTIGPVTFLVQVDGRPANISPEDLAPLDDTGLGIPGVAGGDDDEELDLDELEFDEDDLDIDISMLDEDDDTRKS